MIEPLIDCVCFDALILLIKLALRLLLLMLNCALDMEVGPPERVMFGFINLNYYRYSNILM